MGGTKLERFLPKNQHTVFPRTVHLQFCMSDIKGQRGETSFLQHTAGEIALVFFQISLTGNTTYADSGAARTAVWCLLEIGKYTFGSQPFRHTIK